MGVLDVGSSKVVCLIARRQMDGNFKVVGVGNWACTGILEGKVSDMDATEKAVRQSVELAEKRAGERLESVTLALHCGDPESETITVEVDVDGQTVTEADIDSVIALAKTKTTIADGREIIHAFPAFYMLDGNYARKAPIGMYGEKLSIAMHVMTIVSAPVKNLEMCVRRADMGIDRVVVGPYAAGLATLHAEEMEMGAACIDIGGGTTSISIFTQGKIAYTKVLPMGGDSLTETIARELLTPAPKAERLKNAQGGAIREPIDDRIEIDVPVIGGADDDSDARRMPRSALTYLMHQHYEALLQVVRSHLDSIGFTESGARRIVLTGGASQAENLQDLAAKILGKDVRIAQPALISGLPLSAQNPLFACSTGLLVYNELEPNEVIGNGLLSGKKRRMRKSAPKGMFGKIGSWMKGSY